MSKEGKRINEEAAVYGLRIVGDAGADSGSTDYAMYSEEGNLAVAGVVVMVRAEIAETEAAMLADILHSKLAEVREVHPEVGDTMVRETIYAALMEEWHDAYGEIDTLSGAL